MGRQPHRVAAQRAGHFAFRQPLLQSTGAGTRVGGETDDARTACGSLRLSTGLPAGRSASHQLPRVLQYSRLDAACRNRAASRPRHGTPPGRGCWGCRLRNAGRRLPASSPRAGTATGLRTCASPAAAGPAVRAPNRGCRKRRRPRGPTATCGRRRPGNRSGSPRRSGSARRAAEWRPRRTARRARRQASPSRARSRRKPSDHCTALTDSRRVLASMASTSAASGSGAERISTSRVSTPRCAWASQGSRFEGNSSPGSTTLSPARQSSPQATSETPSVVFLSSEMSSAEAAPVKLRSRPRRERSRWIQRA
jgi:hypothetical protein